MFPKYPCVRVTISWGTGSLQVGPTKVIRIKRCFFLITLTNSVKRIALKGISFAPLDQDVTTPVDMLKYNPHQSSADTDTKAWSE